MKTALQQALSVLLLLSSSASARVSENDARRRLIRRAANKREKIENQWIVRLSDNARPRQLLNDLLGRSPYSSIKHQYRNRAFHGFTVAGVDEAALLSLAERHPNSILDIEEDAEVHAHELVWGLDRIE